MLEKQCGDSEIQAGMYKPVQEKCLRNKEQPIEKVIPVFEKRGTNT